MSKQTQVSDYYVTVCDACRCASCWLAEYGCRCDAYGTAGTVDVLASVLRSEQRELKDWYCFERLRKVTGQSPRKAHQ